MSIVVDSSVWIEATVRAPGWQRFAPDLAKTGDLLIPSVVLAEVRKWFLLKADEHTAAVVLGYLLQHEVVTLDATLAVAAAGLAVDHRLSLGDSIIYATAVHTDSELLTMDAHFQGLPGVRYFTKSRAN